MVQAGSHVVCRALPLSVLALSSRFDGRPAAAVDLLTPVAFSTRSVESF